VEGYHDRWAFPIQDVWDREVKIPTSPSQNDVADLIVEFCKYCNVNPLPTFNRVLPLQT